jgi:hypothetical protein
MTTRELIDALKAALLAESAAVSEYETAIASCDQKSHALESAREASRAAKHALCQHLKTQE